MERDAHQSLSAWIAGKEGSGTYKAITLRSLSACFGWAVKNDLIADNPVRKVTKPRSRSRSVEAIIGEADHKELLEGRFTGLPLRSSTALVNGLPSGGSREDYGRKL